MEIFLSPAELRPGRKKHNDSTDRLNGKFQILQRAIPLQDFLVVQPIDTSVGSLFWVQGM